MQRSELTRWNMFYKLFKFNTIFISLKDWMIFVVVSKEVLINIKMNE